MHIMRHTAEEKCLVCTRMHLTCMLILSIFHTHAANIASVFRIMFELCSCRMCVVKLKFNFTVCEPIPFLYSTALLHNNTTLPYLLSQENNQQHPKLQLINLLL